MKQLLLVLTLSILSLNLFAQEENPRKAISINGEIWARGWIGSQSSGANLKDADTFINFNYHFSDYSGVVFGITADGMVSPLNNQAQKFAVSLGDVYGYTDILRELGVKAVGLKFSAGKFVVENKMYNPGSFGAGDDSITAGDASTDTLNMSMEFNVSRNLVPLVVRIGGDLDFGYRNGKSNTDAIGNKGFGVLAEVALDNMTIADAVTLGVNVYGVVRNNSVDTNTNWLINEKANMHIGGTVGLAILNLPINLKVGGSVNYFNLYTNNIAKTGVGVQAAAELGMNDIFTASLGYKLDQLNDHGHFIGLKASLDLSPVIRPYIGFGFRLDNVKNSEGNNIGFAEKNAVEVGLQIIPINGVSVYVGWNRTGNSTSGDGATHTQHHGGGDVHSPTLQSGWGAAYLKVGFVF